MDDLPDCTDRSTVCPLTWGLTPRALMAGGTLRCLGREMSAKLDWRLWDQMDSQDREWRSRPGGRLRMIVLFL